MEGVVCEGELDHSVVFGVRVDSQGRPPIPGARVVVSFSKQDADVIPGFEAVTGADGHYKIDLANLPPLTVEKDEYYIIVTAKGYKDLRYRLSFKHPSDMDKNSVFLAK